MTSPDAVRAMLGARSVAVVGASARPGSFGERLVTEVLRSPSAPEVDAGQPAVRRRGRTALRRRRCGTSRTRSTSCCSRSTTTWSRSS